MPSARRRLALSAALLPLLAAQPMRAFAASAPITVVVPFTPGGGADQLARQLTEKLRRGLPDTTFVVENHAGANGALASRAFVQRRADGSALLLGTSSTLPLNAALKRLGIDPLADLLPVALLAETANALAVPADAPWKSLADYVEAGQRSELTYASFGNGSSGHLYGLLLQTERTLRLLHVPYKGSAPALNDLLGGHVQSAFLTTSAFETMAREGRVRILAVTGRERVPTLPAVPTFLEQGVRTLDFNGWFGLFAPPGTPPEVLRHLTAAIASLQADRDFVQRMQELGYAWVGGDAARMGDALRQSLDVYRRLVAAHPLE